MQLIPLPRLSTPVDRALPESQPDYFFYSLCSDEFPRPELQLKVLERDSGACVVCGFSTIVERVHIIEESLHPSLNIPTVSYLNMPNL